MAWLALEQALDRIFRECECEHRARSGVMGNEALVTPMDI